MAHWLISGARTARRIRRRPIGLILPALLLLAALVATGCGSGDGAVRSAGAPLAVTSAPAAPPPPPALSRAQLAALPQATTFTTTDKAVPDPSPQQTTDGTVVHVLDTIAVYRRPMGEPIATLPATELQSPTWVPVIARQPGWAQVLLPSRPDASTGWIYVGTGAPVDQARTTTLVDVNVADRKLMLRNGNDVLGEWPVGVGKADTPTPLGRTFIMASIRETVTHFSPIILPLGTHSNTFTTYGGGPGTVGLHGWPDKSKLGTQSSDGCVRVPDDLLAKLTTLPLGTLVVLHD